MVVTLALIVEWSGFRVSVCVACGNTQEVQSAAGLLGSKEKALPWTQTDICTCIYCHRPLIITSARAGTTISAVAIAFRTKPSAPIPQEISTKTFHPVSRYHPRVAAAGYSGGRARSLNEQPHFNRSSANHCTSSPAPEAIRHEPSPIPMAQLSFCVFLCVLYTSLSVPAHHSLDSELLTAKQK